MRRTVPWLVIAGLYLFATTSALAENPKPLAVLFLSSYDSAKFKTDSVGFLKFAQDMPAWLSNLFALYAKGRDVGGLDKLRPWGAVIEQGEKLAVYAFLPVTDAQELSRAMSDQISGVTEQAGGIHKVFAKETSKVMYAKEANGWVFVSDCSECLLTVPENPIELLDGMDKKY